jgi:uncharacterized membrane protein HdeD (DUF308 family)
MKLCKTIKSVLLILAGLALFTNMSIAGMMGAQIAGALIAVIGVVKLVHCFGMCSMCNSCCMDEKKK